MNEPMNPIKVEYEEPNLGSAPPAVPTRVEDIFGQIPRVSAVPTWIPKLFKDGFAIYVSGATYRLYVYDYVGTTWRYTALT
jgi:hypothetical protein